MGTLGFTDDDYEEYKAVGEIKVTQYRMHYIENNGVNKFELFDETNEGLELYQTVIKPMLDSDWLDETLQGDLQLVTHLAVDSAHRGHGLGLFMLEAADNVINGHMSAQAIKPWPLQFDLILGRSNNFGFPDPDPSYFAGNGLSGDAKVAFDAARAKISAYYSRLGFKQITGDWMFRWNGRANPTLSQAMAALKSPPTVFASALAQARALSSRNSYFDDSY